MTKRTCLSCGTVFEDTFAFITCSTCQQTKAITRAMENQSRRQSSNSYSDIGIISPQTLSGGYYSQPSTTLDHIVYDPPTPEELEKKKEIKRLNSLYSIGVDLSILVVWALVWMLTSGWVTFFGFIAAIYVPFYLNEKHQAWKINNSKYLYRT